MDKLYTIRLKKDDTVMVRVGKYKGKTGKVLAVHRKDNTVTVEGINIVKKHLKPNRQNPQGGIVEITKPMAVSKVGILDPVAKKPSRIGFKLDDQGVKTRLLKTSGKAITAAKPAGGKK